MVGKIIFWSCCYFDIWLILLCLCRWSGGSPDGRNAAKEKEGSGKWRKRIRENTQRTNLWCVGTANFWSRRKNGCTRKQCYYLLPKQPEKDTKKAGQCVGCPYGKHSPCIGYCLQKILQDMRKKKSGKEETAYAGRSQ